MIRFGVIGAGQIAHTFSKAITCTEGILYGIASRNIEKARLYQKEYGYQVAYGSYEELVKDELVDCVYVATPHGLHYEHMKLAITHGKHVLCEKSFTINASQAEEIFELAKKHNVFVMEAMWTRFLPTMLELKKDIDAMVIGNIESIDVTFGFDAMQKPKNRLFDPDMGGGALLDIGVYTLTIAHLFLGLPTSFDTQVDLIDHQFDIAHQITLHYHSSTVHMSCALNQDLENKVYLNGSKGYAVIDLFWRTEKANIYDINHHLIKTIAHPHLVNGFEYEIQEVIECIKNHELESSIMTHKTTLEIMHLMDDIRKVWKLKYPGESIKQDI